MNPRPPVHRLLVVDDNHDIHESFRKILCPKQVDHELNMVEADLFGLTIAEKLGNLFEIDSAFQGEDGLRCVENALAEDFPYTIAFIDMQMPPGWDGMQTAQRILAADRHIQVVICTAFSQYSWREITDTIGETERLLILKKPFDVDEIKQLGHSLTQRWTSGHEVERLVAKRSRELLEANTRLQSEMQERMVAETALRLNEQRLQLALEAANDGLWDWDIQLGEIYFSPRWERMLGYAAGEIPGTPRAWNEIIHPDDRDGVMRALKAHSTGEMPTFEAEYRMRTKAGKWLWILGRGKVVSRDNGRPRRFVGTQTDVTERKWIENEMKARERQFRTIVSNIPGVVYRRIGDDDMTMRYLSDFITPITGYPASDFMENSVRSYASVIHPDDRDDAQSSIRQAVADGHPYSIEYRVIDADGDTHWVHDKGSVIEDPEGAGTYLDGVIFDTTATHALSERLSYHEHHDVLTGLLNREQFKRALRDTVSEAGIVDHDSALCYVDLDQFKVINDSCGHAAGDALLCEIGQLLLDRVRDRDVVARLGGDEFGVLLRNCSLDHLDKVTNSLRRAADDYRFSWSGRSYRVGASIGVVPIRSSEQSVENLMRVSEAACYVAKEQGRNRTHLYKEDDSIVIRRTDEIRWVERINRALEEDRFELWHQPIAPIDPSGHTGAHYEVLLRLRDRHGELVSPGVFLPAAERFSLATKIDRWVFDAILGWLASQPAQLASLALCSVNLSGHSLTDSSFVSFFVDALEQSGVPAEKLCIEVTETAAVANLGNARKFLDAIRSQGCKIALDDFGTGHSSFAYLASLPVDYLKIDGSFVKDISTNPVHLAMVRSINEVGQVMGKQTIAEFVEDARTLELLREMGVDYAQGFGIGKPRPLQDPMLLSALNA